MKLAQRQVAFKRFPDLALHVRELSALQAIDLQEALRPAEDVRQIIAVQLVALVANADGTPAFKDAEAAMAFMGTVPEKVVTKLVNEGTELNQLDDEAIENAAKN